MTLRYEPDSPLAACLDRLHHRVRSVSAERYIQGRFDDAAEKAVAVVFSYLQEKTGLPLDGADLVNQSFSMSNPKLSFGELSTVTAKDKQVGFMELLKGLYKGVRNPMAHHDPIEPDPYLAFEYLMLASWCCHRIDEASSAWFNHPTGDERRRGKVTACKFEISPEFASPRSRRWRDHADVLVQFRGNVAPDVRGRFVYLIPSGAAPDLYSKPEFWRNNPAVLEKKRQITEEFAKTHLGQELEGGYFVHQRRDGQRLATVYNQEYDAYLVEGYRKLHRGSAR
jgi:uncharacterized protein (TIGR02391 family)